MESMQDPGECQIQQSAFEGLFQRLYTPDEAFAEDLRRAGFDLSRQQPQYPSPVFKRCLEVACRHVYPQQPEPEAMRLIGARFIEGFLDTIVGKMVGVVLPLLSPEAFLKRYPRFFAMAAPGVKLSVLEEAPRQWKVELHDSAPVPEFNAGMIGAVLQRTGVKPEVRIRERSRFHFVLSVTW